VDDSASTVSEPVLKRGRLSDLRKRRIFNALAIQWRQCLVVRRPSASAGVSVLRRSRQHSGPSDLVPTWPEAPLLRLKPTHVGLIGLLRSIGGAVRASPGMADEPAAIAEIGRHATLAVKPRPFGCGTKRPLGHGFARPAC